ncbi:hypothetical protein EN828_30520 [Mesorhizobium sp. M2D.F.Ca.ET.185.01.1.1]|uniref:hypothetical protein n=1 Tax=unclassified Mesorhizobium TaxID=325217 RepID=UPI000FC9D634|nr:MULTISPECIES: hypothetical protein [unclassified Mesorhizobium]TGP73302.1 hypothetical protein EN870_30170 [bacterium M00.F.Ca.ET.227.01.1.1]TGP84295.1 hypothetical protein EN864_30915 [bacterium M00.F.Ca.ET.221.01.1.1]TGP86929.1 hypothetical protein EN865_30280 [bacterium M00.F.Ca.ET.222.01.1.1]TGU01845.1 hypothetical protein EN806_46440 [bacterium M00.F.Ca.ET.163.01.1.1]TGU19179.1 hypothetical protein EN799_58870 [bacterium M00.F.Ca.ET.156.01.1.1]TGU43080.1 hypothetical protein EN789_296
MTAFLRNTLLAAAAVSALTGSALADETYKSCAATNLNDLWSGRCCSVGSANCLGGGNGGRDHQGREGKGGRGSTNGAGKF